MSNEMNQQPRKRGPMGRMGRGMQPGEKPKDLKKSIKQLAQYIGKYKIAIFIVMICAACSTVFNVAGPKILGKATTALSEGLMEKIRGTGSIDFARIGTILLFVLGLYLMSALFSFIQGWIMTGVTQKVCYQLRKEISEKINRMPMKYFESRTYGEVLSRITNDVDTLGQGLNQSITTIITSVATLIGVLIMMLSISPLMTLIALVILPISMGLIGLVTKKSQKFFRAQQEYLGHINGQVEEVYGGHLVIKAFNREKDTIEEFEKTNNILYDSAWKSQFLSGMMQPIMMFVGNLGYACVALTGGLLAIKNVITIGDIQAFIQYVKNFTQPIQQIAQVINMVQSMSAASERVFEFLNEEEEDQTTENPADIETVTGAVTFDHVQFGYNPDQIIIHDFCAKVKPGQKIAIVGPTGAGKTTMVKLLMRYYDVNSGAILLDDHNIRDFNRRELRDAFGMVLQDTWLFKGSGIIAGTLAAYTVTVMWGATLVARLLIAFVFPFKAPRKAMVVMAVTCTIFYVLLMRADSQLSAILLLFAFAFAMAGMNPTAVASAGKMTSVTSMGIMLPVASSGAILMPWVIGRVAEGAGLAAGMATNIIPCVGLCVFAVLVARER